MKLSNEEYDFYKWLVLIFIPATAVLITGLGEVFGWEWASDLVTVCNLVATFLGSILQISSHYYYNDEE